MADRTWMNELARQPTDQDFSFSGFRHGSGRRQDPLHSFQTRALDVFFKLFAQGFEAVGYTRQEAVHAGEICPVSLMCASANGNAS